MAAAKTEDAEVMVHLQCGNTKETGTLLAFNRLFKTNDVTNQEPVSILRELRASWIWAWRSTMKSALHCDFGIQWFTGASVALTPRLFNVI